MPPKRRRPRGMGFSSAEVNYLLDAVDEYLPMGDDDWRKVLRKHYQQYKYIDWFRTKKSLKRKFESLYRVRMPLRDQSLEVQRAKSIQQKINNKIHDIKQSARADKGGQAKTGGTTPEDSYEESFDDEEEEEGERDNEHDRLQPHAAGNIPRTIFVMQERREEEQVVEVQGRMTSARPGSSTRMCIKNTRELNDFTAKQMMKLMNKITEMEELMEEERLQREQDKSEIMVLLTLVTAMVAMR